MGASPPAVSSATPAPPWPPTACPSDTSSLDPRLSAPSPRAPTSSPAVLPSPEPTPSRRHPSSTTASSPSSSGPSPSTSKFTVQHSLLKTELSVQFINNKHQHPKTP